jgi:hypothetical protein
MAYLSAEEFNSADRNGQVGTTNWPDWHYGILLLYGQNLALNHLIGLNQLNVVNLPLYIDFRSENEGTIFDILHIHAYHDEKMFSKYSFKRGAYDNLTLDDYDRRNQSTIYKYNQVKYYSLRMALEGKLMNCSQLNKLLQDQTLQKD